MARKTYQSYTSDTPIDIYRKDLIWRSAMCAAMKVKYPALEPLVVECNEEVEKIDGKKSTIQRVEDDHVRARALEEVEKLDVIDAYSQLRAIMAAYNKDWVLEFLPISPSRLKSMGPSNLTERVNKAITNINVLPEDSLVRREFLPQLEREKADLERVDHEEDDVRAQLASLKLGLTVYKSELAQLRESQIGSVQAALGNRSKAASFTVPWRKPSRQTTSTPTEVVEPPTTPPIDETPE